ncbi:MAG: MOSC domain-containing protein [Chloroflexi bacterium]|nr:MOSC domain-containing protein [Chloroflexota bacterium]
MTTTFSLEELEQGLVGIDASPSNHGTLEMIVCRPAVGERKLLDSGNIDLDVGLVGDTWKQRGSRHTEDGSAMIEAQITLMNSRVIQLITQDRDRWALAGDQLYVDFNLSIENLPPGQQLAIGEVVLEISDKPHTGCDKFTKRFGHGAIRFVNSKSGRARLLRGVNARVIQPGRIRVGDTVQKVEPTT